MPTITNQINQINQAAGIQNEQAARNPNGELGQKDFLELLTVQLQNQDPLNPQSDMDFIASMSSFTSVEAMSDLSVNFEKFMSSQSVTNEETLDALVRLTESMSNNEEVQNQLAAQFYLGKQVTIDDPVKGEFTGVVDRVELFEKNNLDGSKEQVMGLLVNQEIFPVEYVTGVSDADGNLFGSVGNVLSSVANNLIQ